MGSVAANASGAVLFLGWGGAGIFLEGSGALFYILEVQVRASCEFFAQLVLSVSSAHNATTKIVTACRLLKHSI